MLFAILCQDKPDHLQLRQETRPAHLAYLNDLNAKGLLKFAGPFLGNDGNSNGSLVVIEAENRAKAREIAAGDPYAKAGLFADVEIRAWNWAVNNPAA
ncbi:MAG TPA: YciI-like protein [Rhizobiaceae bacterium]|nr:YciI-like protein [Rhizobiaceae bacterium]